MKHGTGAVLLALSLMASPSAHADSDSGAAKFVSGAGTAIYLGVGTLLPLLKDGKDGKERSIRIADSVLTSTLISEVLKNVVHEKRPDGSDNKSFPSSHATAAFAVATMQSHYHPKQALLWYGGATLIAASRVQLDKHHWHDVAAGAALGYFVSKFELKRPRGLLLTPFIHNKGARHTSTGLSLTRTF